MLQKASSIIFLLVSLYLRESWAQGDDGCFGFADARDDINQDALVKTNQKRQMNNAPPLTLNQTLIDQAQQWARTLAQNNDGSLQHHTEGYGQNLADSCCNADPSVGSGDSVQMWYNEAPCYNGENSNDAPNFKYYGHFTQLVWKSTTTMGCAACQASGDNRWTYWVCNYYPPGNMDGEYTANVDEPYGAQTGQTCPQESSGTGSSK